MYQLADKLSFIYSDAQCGYVGIGRQAWLRAKWGIPVAVRVCLAAPNNILKSSILSLSAVLLLFKSK